MDDRIEEILGRLEALERRLDALEAKGGEAPRCSFLEEERRIVDTIVRLTSETILREVDARMEDHGPPPHHHGPAHDHHGPPHHHGPPPHHHDHGGPPPGPGWRRR